MTPPRFAAWLGIALLSLSLSGCGLGRLHILIPDFAASGVDGIRLFRVVDGGALQAAGRVVFGRILKTTSGEQMEYTQLIPGQDAWGPIMATLRRPKTGQVELEMALYNGGASGYFRFASYNEKGASKLAAGQIFLAKTQ